MLEFFQRNKKWLELLTGILLFTFFNWVDPLGLEPKAKLVLATAVLIITWWILEAMPLAVVALAPIVLFPLLGINTIKETTKSYADSIIFLLASQLKNGTCINVLHSALLI